MSFQTLADTPGRQAASILEIDLDSCENVYGTAPCVATLALQNGILQANTIDNASWTKVNSLIVADNDTAPDGTLTADEWRPDDTIDEIKELRQSLDATLPNLEDTFTYAIYVKVAAVIIPAVRIYIRTNGVDGAFFDINVNEGILLGFGDLDTGAPIQGNPLLQNAFVPPGTQSGIAGWFRISLTFKFGSLTTPEARIAMLDATGAPSFASGLTNGLLIWGVQFRRGPTAGLLAITTAAIIDGTGESDQLCYNTFSTCQDTPNYIKETKTYRFISILQTPIEISDAFPAIRTVNYSPTRLDPGAGMSVRGTVQVELQDFTHNDIGGPVAASQNAVDKYVRLRSLDVDNTGTFFGRLKARNEFYVGRPMRVLEGYLDQPFSLSNFRTREYIIEKIDGPDATGKVRITGKDILAKARNDRAKAPTPSVGVLDGAVLAADGTIDVSAGTGPDYDIDVHVRIDDELLRITSRSVDQLTVNRGQGGTVAADHDDAASVQSCLTYEDEPVIDVIFDLLTNFSNIDSSFIPFTDWQAEETESLSGYDLETIISEPTGVTTLLKEISDSTLIDLWYSDVDQEIKLKLQTPFTEVTQLITDDDHIIEDSMSARDVLEKRLTRVLIYYDMRDFAANLGETSNFRRANFEIEADKELANKFGDERVKIIFSRWFDSSNSVQVQLTSTRLLERFGLTPIEVKFDIDAKDVIDFDTGDAFDLRSRILQATNGEDRLVRLQVIETRPKMVGTRYQYKALSFFVDPATQGPQVVAADETDFDLFVELAGPSAPVEVTVTINAGVTFRSTQGNPAFTTGQLHPESIVTLINNGTIIGHSGFGGRGGTGFSDCSYEGEALIVGNDPLFYFFIRNPGQGGSVGGDAINITIAEFIIDNTGTGLIAGGGGGGGGGRAGANTTESSGGGGGGGGRGGDGVGGGANAGGASGFSFGCPPIANVVGNDGVDGDEAGPGAGGVAVGSSGAGAGGAGGGRATQGVDGGGFPVAPGGGPGFAVRLNGNIVTFTAGNNPAQVLGAVA